MVRFVYIVIWMMVLVTLWSAFIGQLSFTFDFKLHLFSRLLYCIPAYSLSLILNYHHYIIYFVIKSPTVRSILPYLSVL